jgi:hypothetical protein
LGARERAALLPAGTPAGIRAKAQIFLGETSFGERRYPDSLDGLAISLARDLVNETSGDPSRDAELIAICDRLTEIEAERREVLDTIDDEVEQDKANASREEEWVALAVRVVRIGRPSTRAGAEAMARAANANASRNVDGVPMAADLGEFLALGACAYLADSASPVTRS